MPVQTCDNEECRYHDPDDPAGCDKPLTSPFTCPNAKLIDRDGAKPKNFYLKELESNGCACGGPKGRGKSFCYRCYKSLPDDMQRALYRPFTGGYIQAYDAAVKYLDENVW